MAYLICRGGWLSSIEDAPKIALKHAYDYLDSVIDSGIITMFRSMTIVRILGRIFLVLY